MSPVPDPETFSRDWALSWNSRDVEAVLTHFHDDARFTSPIAARIGASPSGVIEGKSALREYWTAALALNPDLHFEVTAVYAGVETLVIAYRTQTGEDRVEVLRFRNALIDEGHGLLVNASQGTAMTTLPDTRSLVFERIFNHPPEKLWRVLTRPELIERWLISNDFEPRVGHRFNFRATPVYGWNGVTDCKVLEVVANQRLVYTWKASGDQAADGLSTVVAWMLAPVAAGTRLRMVQSGFRPQDEDGYSAMGKGWETMLETMASVAAEV